ncbi:MAG: signal peptide peptidase SppA [Acidobacteriota bacterium]|nr:signal peptide peptidase SppA [Acidobacteriota bacterium]
MLEGIDQARKDPKIQGLLVEVDSAPGWAQAEELRKAIEAFSADGKWSVAFTENAGSAGAYLLATACQEVVLAPPGEVGLYGLRAETPFLRGLFDKLHILPQMAQRKEFKNAADVYMRRDYSPAHRQAMNSLLGAIFGDLVDSIAGARGLTPERVRELVDQGPFLANEALEASLVDRLAYKDEVLSSIRARVGRDKPFIRVEDYIRRHRAHRSRGAGIALIYAVGTIARGESEQRPLGDTMMGSKTIIRALREAREDDSIKAVVLRIDSPGGSYVASDLMRREIVLTRQKKPVIASMGNVAASGGYFIAMQTDHILADRATITGSIGVLSGKLVTGRFWDDITGIHFSGIQIGENADMYSSLEPFDEQGWKRLNAILDAIYADFVGKAAEGRSMTYDQLEPLAHGRVWTGSQAFERGLVDEIGGLGRALEIAAERGGFAEGQSYRLLVLPRPPGFFDMLRQRRGLVLASELPASLTDLARVMRLLQSTSGDCYLYAADLPRIR